MEGPCRSCPHTTTEWRRNYDSARGFALDATLKPIPAGMEDTSELIAQPIVGGKAHANIHLFKSGDADHTTLKQWLGGAKLGMTCTTTDQIGRRRTPMKRIGSLFVMALALFLAPAANAFPHLYFWQDTANGPNGGAGFLYGTGSQGVGTFNNGAPPGDSTTSCTQLSTVPGAAITLEQNLATKGGHHVPDLAEHRGRRLLHRGVCDQGGSQGLEVHLARAGRGQPTRDDLLRSRRRQHRRRLLAAERRQDGHGEAGRRTLGVPDRLAPAEIQ